MTIIANNLHDNAEFQKRPSEEEKKKRPHVLVMPYPALGHINPMMHLSRQLAANGVIITFVNTQFNHDRIMEAQVNRSRVQTSESESDDKKVPGDIRMVGIPDGLGHEDYVVNMDVPKISQAIIDIEPLFVKLVEELQPPVTCIIADVFVISTPAVARRFGIPHITFWTQSAANYSAHVYFTQNHAFLKEYLGKLRGEEDQRRVITCIPGCPALSYKEVPTFLQACDPSDFCFSYVMESFQTTQDNSYVLMNTIEELEADTFTYIQTPNMLCIGPVLPSEFVNDNESSSIEMTPSTSFWVGDREGCLPWLDQQAPSSVLYVSFGSIALMSAQQVSEFAAGLEASGYPFLMVVRPEMLTGGASVSFPHGFALRMRNSGRAVFVAWAPQLEVLAHPAVGGFLTHAGWNSTLESLCRGVPMLCWPYFADQMLNTRCIVDTWRIGFDFVMEEVVDEEKITTNSAGGGDGDSGTTSSNNNNNTHSNGSMVSLVKREEIEHKVKQLMDPFTSREIREQVHMWSRAVKKTYEYRSHSNFSSLLNLLFG
eukprot:c23180_g1_i1 orf=213-1835(-)